MKRILIFALGALLSFESAVYAQGFSLSSLNGKRKGSVPTTIKADAMDIDIANNKAAFLGNVFVDDQDMTITCRKMTIFLLEEKSVKKEAGKNDEQFGSDRKLDRIECVDNVIITRKNDPGKDVKSAEVNKATAGKAVYDFRKGTITLTIDPVIHKGVSKLNGEVITLYLESERLAVVGGKMQSSDLKNINLK